MVTENPQGDWQADAARKMDVWLNDGFGRINTALEESGALTSLQDLFAQRNIKDQYIVFDAKETSRGFPVPVRTRYVVPTFTDEPNVEAVTETAYPGIAVTEVVGLGVRTLNIQFGLGSEEMLKVSCRGQAVLARNSRLLPLDQKKLGRKRPVWWNSPRPAVDMTQDYDLKGDIELAVSKIAQKGDDKAALWDVYLYGSPTITPGVVSVTFERETSRKEGVERTWEESQEQVQEGLDSLARMIDTRLPTGQS